MAEVKVAHNHDEQVERTNEGIALDNEREVAQQEEWLQKQQDIADDVGKRAPFNVVLVGEDGEEDDAIRLDTLTAVVVYGRSGSGRYDVVEGDTYVRIVLEGATKEDKKKAKADAKAEAEEAKDVK